MNNLERIQTLSLDAVEERLPLLRLIIDDVVRTWKLREEARTRLSHFRRELVGSGSSELTETIARLESEEEQHAADLVLLEQEVNQVGGLLKDPGKGQVDFFSERDGHLVYLSWRPGDESVKFWHEIDDDGTSLREIVPQRRRLEAPETHPRLSHQERPRLETLDAEQYEPGASPEDDSSTEQDQ